MSINQKTLITGATGFLGSWIVARLTGQGVPVVAADINRDYRRLSLLQPQVPDDLLDVRICDVTDGAAVEALVSETRPSAIIHLAALQIPVCRANPAAGAMVNVAGHVNIFEAARKAGIRRVIYTSSIAAKPRGPDNAPSNLYGVYKKTCEEIARIYWQDHQLPSLGLRPYIAYGVGRDDGETSAITRAIEAAALGRAYEIPFATRSCFQFAGDLADVFAAATRADWQGAVLSDITDTVHSTEEVLAAIQALVPGAKVSGAGNWRVSPDSGFETGPLRQVLGGWEETPLREGIRQTIALYRRVAAQA